MKEKYFVYWNDDYPDLGGVGFEQFETEQLAIEFIEKRMHGTTRALDEYQIVKGTELKLVAAEFVSRIRVE